MYAFDPWALRLLYLLQNTIPRFFKNVDSIYTLTYQWIDHITTLAQQLLSHVYNNWNNKNKNKCLKYIDIYGVNTLDPYIFDKTLLYFWKLKLLNCTLYLDLGLMFVTGDWFTTKKQGYKWLVYNYYNSHFLFTMTTK